MQKHNSLFTTHSFLTELRLKGNIIFSIRNQLSIRNYLNEQLQIFCKHILLWPVKIAREQNSALITQSDLDMNW